MLEVLDVSKAFGGLQALGNVNLKVKEGEIIGLIGPNGSGKTTLFNVITGLLKPTAGKIMFDGSDISGQSPNAVCQAGITRTFQVPRPFFSLNVLDNVRVSMIFGSESAKHMASAELEKQSMELIEFVGLSDKELFTTDQLTVIDLRRLEVARALATKPKLLLADEILSGLTHEELTVATEMIKKIWKEMGITVIWVEHILGAIMNVVERAIVLNFGRVIADGEPTEVTKRKEVIDAYLGD